MSGAVNHVDIRSDMYSFAATLYHMLTGAPPFAAKDTEVLIQKHIKEPPPFPHKLNPEVPLKISCFVNKLLSKKLDGRPASWHEVINALEDIKKHPFEIAEKITYQNPRSNHTRSQPLNARKGFRSLPAIFRRVLALLVKIIIVALLATIILFTWHWWRSADMGKSMRSAFGITESTTQPSIKTPGKPPSPPLSSPPGSGK